MPARAGMKGEVMSSFRSITRLTACLLCSSFVIASPSEAAAQTAETADAGLSGRVWQVGTQAALSGVIVRIRETGQSTTTDAQGGYRFAGLSAGTYTLSFDYLGYPMRSESVRIAPGMKGGSSTRRRPYPIPHARSAPCFTRGGTE